jgi:potassium efflux system protein
MKTKILGLLAVLLLAGWAVPIRAQTTQPENVSVAEFRQLRQRSEVQIELSDDLRTQIIDLYDAAIAALETAAENKAAAQAFERDRKGVDRLEAELRSELDTPIPPPKLALPDNPTVRQAEEALERERSRLAAKVSALREQQRLADDRTKTRADISRRLGELDLQLEQLNQELRSQVDRATRTELKTAVRHHAIARIHETDSEIEMLRAKLALLTDRSALIPLRTDLAQRRVSISNELVRLHAAKAHQLRLEEARTLLAQVRELGDRVRTNVPQLADLTAETEEMAETLWGPEGIVTASEQTGRDLAATRDYQTQLNRIAELTIRKFEAYGHRGSVSRWWPDIPTDFPKTAIISRTLRELDEEIPEVEHKLITFEQKRAQAHDLRRTTLRTLRAELGAAWTAERERQVLGLFSVRQNILDRVIQRGGSYSNQLVEYRAVAGNFLVHVERVEKFLYSHLLWSRSVPRPVIPRVQNVASAAGWLFSSEHFEALTGSDLELRGSLLPALLTLLLTLILRRPLKKQLRGLAARVSDPDKDTPGLTFRAVIVSLLLAAPLPLALYFVGMLIGRIGDSMYWIASSRAFIELTFVAALLESIRQIFAPRGLAEVHFGWPSTATKPLYRGLLRTEVLGLPLLYVALHLAFAGMRLESSPELQLHNNTLGRIAFIAALSVFGIAILAMMRPERKRKTSENDMRVPWPRRFSEYAFPTAFLGAYPIVIFATIVPAVLAALGYYITGLLLAYQMLRTLLLATLLLVAGGFSYRSRVTRRHRRLLASDGEDLSQTEIRELETAENQSHHLVRFFMAGILAVGLFAIWSDALPMLQLLKRVQLLPRVELLAPAQDPVATLAVTQRTSDASATQTTDSGETQARSQTSTAVSGTAPATATSPASEPRQPLTLWLLLEAVLAAAITFVLVRNLPGVIEITLKRRTTLDAGARFAFSTLVKYTTTIVGSVAVFSLLGIGWSKVQWLAAALTFGLGFGLQEIVANFVSGLILLVERPVRVGDVVTIGNLMGKVSRIQIRATTITLWDRSEMVVPNKEFITTKLVNWTLSDSKRRIEIPLRVAYGTDLEEVKRILIGAAESHPLVLEDPAPQALLIAFGDDAINFELRFVVDFGNGIKAKDDVQMAIDEAFKESGIEFALPQLRLRLPDEEGRD